MIVNSFLDRREFLKVSLASAIAPAITFPARVLAQTEAPRDGKADYRLQIRRTNIELAPQHIVSTTTYNDQFPGPLLRFTEGRRVIVDIFNDTGVPEQLHWHGQEVPVDVDGAAEEGTPVYSRPWHATHRLYTRSQWTCASTIRT